MEINLVAKYRGYVSVYARVPVINNNVVMEIRHDSRESIENKFYITWWRHDIKKGYILLTFCDGNSSVVSMHLDAITIDTALVYMWIKVIIALLFSPKCVLWNPNSIMKLQVRNTFFFQFIMKYYEVNIPWSWVLVRRGRISLSVRPCISVWVGHK